MAEEITPQYGTLRRVVAWIGPPARSDGRGHTSSFQGRCVYSAEEEQAVLTEVLSNPANTFVRVLQCVREFMYMETLVDKPSEIFID